MAGTAPEARIAPSTFEQVEACRFAHQVLADAGFTVKLLHTSSPAEMWCVEIHKRQLDPAEITFVLTVAATYELNPFVLRAGERDPVMILMHSAHMYGEPADDNFAGDHPDMVLLDDADTTEAVPETADDEPRAYRVFNFGSSVMLAYGDDDQHTFSLATGDPDQVRIASEVAEAVGDRITALVAAGADIGQVFDREAQTGLSRYAQATGGQA